MHITLLIILDRIETWTYLSVIFSEDNLGNVMIVTTNWDKTIIDRALWHETDLKTNFWAGMIAVGSSTTKRIGKQSVSGPGLSDPVRGVVTHMLVFAPICLLVPRELANKNHFSQTAASMYISQCLSQDLYVLKNFKTLRGRPTCKQWKRSKNDPMVQQLKLEAKGYVRRYRDQIRDVKEDNVALRRKISEKYVLNS